MARDILADDETEKKPIELETFKKDVENVMAAREKVANANQAHGTDIKTLESERGYHMGAFKQICTLAKKSPEQKADFLRTFMAGIEALEIGKTQGDMFDDAPSNVTELPRKKAAKSTSAKNRTKELQH